MTPANLSFADEVDLKPFFGKIPGKEIEIKPYRSGFLIQFLNREENIVFLPRGLQGHFLARNSGDILKGEQYLWAIVKNNLLKIHVFKFDEKGNYKIDSFCYDCQGAESLENLFPYSLTEDPPQLKANESLVELKDFYGVFVGQAKEVPKVKTYIPPTRDIDLVIKPFRRGKGFSIKWVTVIYQNNRTDKSVKRREAQAWFVPSDIPTLFQPYYKKNPFKINKNPDLLKGDQLQWARLISDHLTIYTLQITEDGEYILKSYDRELTENGSIITFISYVDGVKDRVVKGTMTRVKPDVDDD